MISMTLSNNISFDIWPSTFCCCLWNCHFYLLDTMCHILNNMTIFLEFLNTTINVSCVNQTRESTQILDIFSILWPISPKRTFQKWNKLKQGKHFVSSHQNTMDSTDIKKTISGGMIDKAVSRTQFYVILWKDKANI